MYIIVDPDRDGATIWNVGRHTVQHIKGTPDQVVKKIFDFATCWDDENKKYIQRTDIGIDKAGVGHFIVHELRKRGLEITEIDIEIAPLYRL